MIEFVRLETEYEERMKKRQLVKEYFNPVSFIPLTKTVILYDPLHSRPFRSSPEDIASFLKELEERLGS